MTNVIVITKLENDNKTLAQIAVEILFLLSERSRRQ